MSQNEVTSSSEEIKLVVLSIIELCLAEGISWSVIRKKKFLKLHSYLLKGFRVNLKTFLGLTIPNQYCQTVPKLS